MTTGTLPEAPAAPAGPWLRRHRSTLAIVLGLAAAVAVVVALGSDVGRTAGTLDPGNPDPEGARALARVLADQGVDVTVVRSADAFDATEVDAETTVLVTSTDQLGSSTIHRLLDHGAPARLVLAEPGPGTTEALGIENLPYSVSVDEPRAADCADPTYDGLSLQVDEALEYPGPGGCFRVRHGSLLREPRPGLVLLGAAEALGNDQVLRADDAAVALRLLGRHPRLVWYVPTVDDLVGGDGVSLATLLPRWLRPALWLALIAAAGLVLWRARRLGPLATEPLPVVVKAVETTRSRGRLYRKAGDRTHAAAVLREAARRSAGERLRLGTRPDPTTLVADVARHTGRPVEEVEALIGATAPAPATDHDLIALATRLAELDREVRRT